MAARREPHAHILEPLRRHAVAISRLVTDDDNARRHPERQQAALRDSLRRFGQRLPLVACRSGRSQLKVIVGNARLVAARELGWPSLAVVVVDKSDARAFALADNRLAELAEWDDEALARQLASLSTDGGDLTGLGWNDAEIEKLAQELQASLAAEPVAEPAERSEPDEDPGLLRPPRKRRTKVGELWRLGEHRLLCGDAFDDSAVDELLAGRVVDCVLTDPPFAIYGSSTGVDSSIADDAMVAPFFTRLGEQLHRITRELAHVYVFCDWRSYPRLADGMKRALLAPLNVLVWDKGDFGLGCHWPNAHEFLAYFGHLPAQATAFKSMKPKGAAGSQRQVNDHANILRFPRVRGQDRQHNAAKPVALCELILSKATEPGETVADLFGGRGSILLAAERQLRRAVLVEKEPRWCDVILARWEHATGQTAERMEAR